MKLEQAKEIKAKYKELKAKYPDIMAKQNGGFEEPLGWYSIIEEAVEFIHVNGGKIAQLKEKFGQARCYVDWTKNESLSNENFEELHNKLNTILAKSDKVCIICGEPATMTTSGWMTHRCDEHAEWKYPSDPSWREIW